MNRGRLLSPARLAALATLATLALPTAAGGASSATVKVYFMKGEQFSTVPRNVSAAERPEVAAARELFAGPTAAEWSAGLRTAVPPGSRVVSVRLKGSTVTVNVHFATPKKESPFQASLRPARTSQIAATLRSVAGVKTVLLYVDGLPVPVANATTGPTGRPPDPPNLEPESKAPADVLGVQSRLADLHYLPRDAVTGTWDYRTWQAVLAFQSWEGLTRDGDVGPKTLAAMDAANVPEPTQDGTGRWIEVYKSVGVALLIQNGGTIRAIHVSSGAPGYDTPNGTFKVFRKERFSWSVPYKVWLPYASYFSGGIAFHAYAPVPTSPASHGCVRVPYPEAPFVYYFAAFGRSVTVYS